MKRKVILFVLLAVVMAGMCSQAYASVLGTMIRPALTFNGTTALCGVTISEYGKSIDATLTLKHGSQSIATWHKTGTSVVTISGSAYVDSGETYTLELTGTIGGLPINSAPVTGTCP